VSKAGVMRMAEEPRQNRSARVEYGFR